MENGDDDKMTDKTVGILNRPQKEINRQFYKMLTDAEAGDASAIQALAEKIGDETTANTILKRLKDVETGIGKASGTGAGGMLKDIKDCKDAIGTEETADTILKRIKDIETAIGTEETEGSILYRIKTLEPSG